MNLLKSWVKSAWNIIPNDTDIAYELLNFQIENRLFNFCVGETVGRKTPEILGVFLTNFPVYLEGFHTNLDLTE